MTHSYAKKRGNAFRKGKHFQIIRLSSQVAHKTKKDNGAKPQFGGFQMDVLRDNSCIKIRCGLPSFSPPSVLIFSSTFRSVTETMT